jgi:hypothetical protein
VERGEVQQQEREHDEQTKSPQLLPVAPGREVVGLSEVKAEVRDLKDQPGYKRDLHEPPLVQDRRSHQQDGQGEVERAVVPDQVLVVGSQCRDPVPAG